MNTGKSPEPPPINILFRENAALIGDCAKEELLAVPSFRTVDLLIAICLLAAALTTIALGFVSIDIPIRCPGHLNAIEGPLLIKLETGDFETDAPDVKIKEGDRVEKGQMIATSQRLARNSKHLATEATLNSPVSGIITKITYETVGKKSRGIVVTVQPDDIHYEASFTAPLDVAPYLRVGQSLPLTVTSKDSAPRILYGQVKKKDRCQVTEENGEQREAEQLCILAEILPQNNTPGDINGRFPLASKISAVIDMKNVPLVEFLIKKNAKLSH